LLLLTFVLTACGQPPSKPNIDPGEMAHIDAGKKLVVKANSDGADVYNWTLSGDGNIPTISEETIPYTAPIEGNTVGILSVRAANQYASSPPTSLNN